MDARRRCDSGVGEHPSFLAAPGRLVRRKPRDRGRFGAMKGEIKITDAFFEPLPEAELKLWEGR